MSIDGRSERDRDSLASYTDFIFLFTVFRVHLPGRNRFDFLLFGKLFFLAASSFFFVFASWLTFSVHRSSYSCSTTTVSFAFIPLSFFYVCELLLFVHKIRIHSIRIVCEIQYAAKNAYFMEKPRRKDKTSVVTRCSYENRNDQFSVWVKICQHRCE